MTVLDRFANSRLGQILCFFLFQFSCVISLNGQTYAIDTLQYTGPTTSRINLVIVGDGYTQTEMDFFKADARQFVQHFFKTEPFIYYHAYLNVFAIETVSEESGALHPCTSTDCPTGDFLSANLPPRYNRIATTTVHPPQHPKTRFESTFDSWGIHRLVVPNEDKVKAVIDAHIPEATQVVVLVNSPFYGGSGGKYATATVNYKSTAIAVHEIGHSFANLADEYWAGVQYAQNNVNLSSEALADVVPWKHWIGYQGVGVYAYGAKGAQAQWYRPHEACNMQYLDKPFCPVCQEQIVKVIQAKSNPMRSVWPTSDSLIALDKAQKFAVRLTHPMPNTLSVQWRLNGEQLSAISDSIYLSPSQYRIGLNQLTVQITDHTSLIRDPNYTNPVTTHEWNWQMENAAKLEAPTLVWGTEMEVCFNKPQVLTIANPIEGLHYEWRYSPEGEIFAKGVSVVVSPLTAQTSVYVQARSNDSISDFTSVHLNVFESVPTPRSVKVKWNRKTQTYTLQVKNADAAEYRYIWTDLDGKPLVRCSYNDSSDCHDGFDGKLTVPLSGLPKIVFVQQLDKTTTCSSARREVRMPTK